MPQAVTWESSRQGAKTAKEEERGEGGGSDDAPVRVPSSLVLLLLFVAVFAPLRESPLANYLAVASFLSPALAGSSSLVPTQSMRIGVAM